MTTYVIWPKNIDVGFRTAYASEVGENIQDNPQETVTHYVVGSSRLNQANMNTLINEFSDVVFSDTLPEDLINNS